MKRSHRLLHAVLWTMLGPGILALVVIAVMQRAPGDDVFGPVPPSAAGTSGGDAP